MQGKDLKECITNISKEEILSGNNEVFCTM